MVKKKNTDQLNFFAPTTDDVQRHTYKSADEKQFERQRHFRSKRQKPDSTMPESGPCCGRCRYWMAPIDLKDDPYGRCRIRVLTTDRHPQLGDAGVGMLRTEDGLLMISRTQRFTGLVMVEGMRTLAGFDCASYQERGQEVAA